MGMSIDKAINHGQEQLEIFGGEHREFIETAVDTMRKYQKIEEIYKNWCYPTHINAVEAMNKLGEVLEDGKV